MKMSTYSICSDVNSLSDLCISINKFTVKIFVCFARRTNVLHQLYSSLGYYVGTRHIKHWWFLLPVGREGFHSFGTLKLGYCWQQVFIIRLKIVLVWKPGPKVRIGNKIKWKFEKVKSGEVLGAGGFFIIQ